MEETTKRITFAALDPFVERNTILPIETEMRGKDYVQWGDGNRYPDYLLKLYKTSPTLKAIVDGFVDYVCGNDVISNTWKMANKEGQTMKDLVRSIALNLGIYNGAALQVIRNANGEPIEIYSLPMRNVRTTKKKDVFWYSEDWAKGNRTKAIVYPKFIPGINTNENAASSIVYWTSVDFQTYPQPYYAAATNACEVEQSISEFHLNEINNGFMGSYLINFNNGVPTDEIREEIEKDFNSKFSGKDNAGRIMFSWNMSKESAATLQKLEISDYGDKYKTLSEFVRQQIFTSFRAVPALFGINPQNNGFSLEEYEQAFKLFNRTIVLPAQRTIVDLIDMIIGIQGSIEIKPFSLEDTNTNVD